MPARKRAKGKARKAAKANKVLPPETETKKNDDTADGWAAAKQEDSEQQLHELIQGLTLSNKCNHGQLPPSSDLCSRFVSEFMGILRLVMVQTSHKTNVIKVNAKVRAELYARDIWNGKIEESDDDLPFFFGNGVSSHKS